MFCKECGSTLADTDRFCPACGTPNMMSRFHPQFDPGHFEQPVFDELPKLEPGTPFCPRCRREVEVSQHWCGSCGMDLAEAWKRHQVMSAGGLSRKTGPNIAYGYRSVKGLKAVAAPLLLVGTLCAVLAGAADVWLLASLADRGPALASSSDTLAGVVRTLDAILVVLLAAGWLFVARWLTVAYRNLPAMRVSGLRYALWWPVACWFVPGWNLFRPKQLMDDVWRASDPGAPVLSSGWRLGRLPLWAALWWPAMMIGALATCVSLTAAVPGFEGLSQRDAATALVFGTIGAVALAVAALSLVLLLEGATDRQEARAAMLERNAQESTPTPMVDMDIPDVQLAKHEKLFGRY